MLCTNCKKENAVFFYQQNINGKSSSVALCKSCSKKFNSPSANFGFFEPFLNTESQTKKVCNLCGLSFNDIRKLGKVGCPECYNTFKDELSVIIKQIHGGAKHCGTTIKQSPQIIDNSENELKLLQEKLNDAISNERYEEAATIRDKIKELKGEKI